MQTHVCVQQTVIDLLLLGYEVHVVADACSSRSQIDRLIAIEVGGERPPLFFLTATVWLVSRYALFPSGQFYCCWYLVLNVIL